MYSAHCIGCLLLAQLFLAGAPWCYRILLTLHHVAIESCLFILVFSLFLASFLVLKDIYVGIDWFYILSFFPFLSVLLFLGALGYSQSDGTETHHLKKKLLFFCFFEDFILGFLNLSSTDYTRGLHILCFLTSTQVPPSQNPSNCGVFSLEFPLVSWSS